MTPGFRHPLYGPITSYYLIGLFAKKPANLSLKLHSFPKVEALKLPLNSSLQTALAALSATGRVGHSVLDVQVMVGQIARDGAAIPWWIISPYIYIYIPSWDWMGFAGCIFACLYQIVDYMIRASFVCVSFLWPIHFASQAKMDNLFVYVWQLQAVERQGWWGHSSGSCHSSGSRLTRCMVWWWDATGPTKARRSPAIKFGPQKLWQKRWSKIWRYIISWYLTLYFVWFFFVFAYLFFCLPVRL